jgi:putative transposase
MSRQPITINNPGDGHDLTFSCYKRLPLLYADHAKAVLLSNVDKARTKHDFDVWAYVIMPEHVHLLIHPRKPVYSIEEIRKSIRQQTAKTLQPLIRAESPKLAEQLRVLTNSNRYWQKGKRIDRD